MEEEKQIKLPISREEQVKNDMSELIHRICYGYGELDVLDKRLKGTINAEERIQLTKEYHLAGVVFRGSIVVAFGLLRIYHHKKDHLSLLEYEEKLGERVLETLQEAREYRDKITELLQNYIEQVDDLEEELELQEMLEEI